MASSGGGGLLSSEAGRKVGGCGLKEVSCLEADGVWERGRLGMAWAGRWGASLRPQKGPLGPGHWPASAWICMCGQVGHQVIQKHSPQEEVLRTFHSFS